MTRSELEKHFGTCRSLSAEQWAFAVLLGRARTHSNKHRAARSDRDAKGNEEVDLHGALGELVLLGILRQLPDSRQARRYMRDHMFHEGGGSDVKGADLRFADQEGDVGIDVKTFDCAANKRYFAINDNKHQELAGECVGYMGLICPPYAHNACITRLIPYDHVSTWRLEQLRRDREGRPRGTPSRNLPIGEAMQKYSGVAYDWEANRSDVYAKAAVYDLARAQGGRSVIVRLSRLLPVAAPYLRQAQATL